MALSFFFPHCDGELGAAQYRLLFNKTARHPSSRRARLPASLSCLPPSVLSSCLFSSPCESCSPFTALFQSSVCLLNLSVVSPGTCSASARSPRSSHRSAFSPTTSPACSRRRWTPCRPACRLSCPARCSLPVQPARSQGTVQQVVLTFHPVLQLLGHDCPDEEPAHLHHSQLLLAARDLLPEAAQVVAASCCQPPPHCAPAARTCDLRHQARPLPRQGLGLPPQLRPVPRLLSPRTGLDPARSHCCPTDPAKALSYLPRYCTRSLSSCLTWYLQSRLSSASLPSCSAILSSVYQPQHSSLSGRVGTGTMR